MTIPNTLTSIEDNAFYGCSKLSTVYYNGTETDWNKIQIGDLNTNLSNATRIYFAYINIFDQDGNKVIDTTQNMGEKLDTSAITVPDGAILKLYTDKEMTQEYSLDTPISENLTLYYDIIEINKLKISGAKKADIGQKGIKYNVSFATDKTAKYLAATVKYSADLNLIDVQSDTFDIEQDEYIENGQKYLSLTCTYKDGKNIPTNTSLNPFDLIFDISENATANDTLNIEFVNGETLLSDESGNNYLFDDVGKAETKINPILVNTVSINGSDEIDTKTKYTATVSPENATNKEVEWTVDNSEIATISQDGTLTPVKAGTVKIKATAKDGSGIFAEKPVNVKVYAQIKLLSANTGVWDKAFTPSEREYTIYVPTNASSIRLTAEHSGKLQADNKTFISKVGKTISLTNDETVLMFTYSTDGYTDSTYTVKIVKFEGTKTTVSADGKTFNIKPINIANGNTVILVLHNGEKFADVRYEKYNGADISFASDKAYTNAKVMVWDNLDDMTPVCEVENVK